MSVKVYTVSLENPKHEKGMFNSRNPKLHEPCFIKADVVLKDDYDKLEARCKELEEKIKVFNLSPNTINSDLQRAFEKEHSKAEILKKENRILKAKLEKCKEQRNEFASEICGETGLALKLELSECNKELDSIGE